MPRRNRSATRPKKASNCDNGTSINDQRICYEGESLASLLKVIKSEIDSARNACSSLPEKVWTKLQFSIGINEVTRVLERMHPTTPPKDLPHRQLINSTQSDKTARVQLQAILLASDCNPRQLTKHLPNLAHSRGVPLIFVKDEKGASLRLGELLKLKTAIAIGIKARGNTINQLIDKILIDKVIRVGNPESIDPPLT
ncbi:hypothetical protein M9H77_15277 [Catharanthus roseus]|uniref:Uncharacterized protein n=1 Tax=Catharanthus roseus TaxID=4058 RepID=A0ACC0AX24_CATRO|nr:hypothetical protein M9H77_15277 [Catharanthus roseus]